MGWCDDQNKMTILWQDVEALIPSCNGALLVTSLIPGGSWLGTMAATK